MSGETTGALDQPVSRRIVVKAGMASAAGTAWGQAAPAAPAMPLADEAGMLTDVPGFLVGHATLEESVTGGTVILCPPSTTGGVEIRGGWTGTRDMDILSPLSASPHVHALLFTGGSTYGLAAADGVMRFLEERMANRRSGLYLVPQVPAAVIYDLAVADPTVRPGANEGYRACETTTKGFERGSVGAGTGASVGPVIPGTRRMKGGLGSASRRFGAEGVQPPIPSLGSLLRDGKTYMEIAPWTMLFPGLTLAAAILAVNLLGDELQAFSDPRLRRR